MPEFTDEVDNRTVVAGREAMQKGCDSLLAEIRAARPIHVRSQAYAGNVAKASKALGKKRADIEGIEKDINVLQEALVAVQVEQTQQELWRAYNELRASVRTPNGRAKEFHLKLVSLTRQGEIFFCIFNNIY